MFVKSNEQMEREAFVKQVVSNLERVIYEGGSGNFVIYEFADPYYVQIASERGAVSVHCEAVSNSSLKDGNELNDDQLLAMYRLGWCDCSDSYNHTISLPVDSDQARKRIAELFFDTAVIYGTTDITNVQVELA